MADLLRVDTSTVRRWTIAGIITPAVTTPGGHYRYDADAVVEQLKTRPAAVPA